MEKTVKQIIDSQDVMMGNTRIGQPIPSSKVDQIDPFLLLHHGGPKVVQPGRSPLDVGPHPHRGFEPVTFVFKGYVGHKDSQGNDQVVGPGGVQWMTAGRGIVHSEIAPAAYYENGGEFELIQLWINLPSSLKMSAPKYQPASREQIPHIDENGTRANIIAGSYHNTPGPIDSLTGIQALTLEMQAEGRFSVDIDPQRSVLLYQLHGRTDVNGKRVNEKQVVDFEKDGDTVNILCHEEAVILLLSGEPINEPVVSHGPFVMNTTTEVMEAMRDYSMGKMGVL